MLLLHPSFHSTLPSYSALEKAFSEQDEQKALISENSLTKVEMAKSSGGLELIKADIKQVHSGGLLFHWKTYGCCQL